MIHLDKLKTALAAVRQQQATRLHWVLGIRFAIACGVPAIIGVAAGRPLAGVIAGIGALLPMLADIGGDMRERLTLMFATSLFMTAGLIAGAATSGHF